MAQVVQMNGGKVAPVQNILGWGAGKWKGSDEDHMEKLRVR